MWIILGMQAVHLILDLVFKQGNVGEILCYVLPKIM